MTELDSHGGMRQIPDHHTGAVIFHFGAQGFCQWTGGPIAVLVTLSCTETVRGGALAPPARRGGHARSVNRRSGRAVRPERQRSSR